jgi:2-oxoglutarate ferredoxin oxidoreductase subunit alpha
MREPLELYDPQEKGIALVESFPLLGLPGIIGENRTPQHLSNIYSLEEELYEKVMSFSAVFEKISPEIVEYEETNCDGADIILISHGVVSRAAHDAMLILRSQGIKAGYFRPITLRPFPEEALRKAILQSKTKRALIAESSYGQLTRLIKQSIYGETMRIDTLYKPGVGIVDYDIINKVKHIL